MGDLISRKEAISTIKSMLYQTAFNSVESDEEAAQLYEDIADSRIETWLKLVDSVDAMPMVHGRWVERMYKTGDITTISYFCSECGGEHYFGRANYCPNCGAKMDGDANG